MAKKPRSSELQRKYKSEVAKLTAIYVEAREEILGIIRSATPAEMASARARARKLAQVSAVIAATTDEARNWASTTLPAAYKESVIATRGNILDAGGTLPFLDQYPDPDVAIGVRFGGIHRKQAEIITNNAVAKFEEIETFVGRKVSDSFRRISLKALGESQKGKLEEGIDIKKRIVQLYDEKSLPAFRDKLGREWQIDRYAEMVGRTSTREVITVANVTENLQEGYDLHDVIGISSFPDSPCVDFEGKQLSATGRKEGYETIQGAMAQGFFHPNCLTYWNEILTSEGAKPIGEVRDGMIAFSASGTPQKIVKNVERDHIGKIHTILATDGDMRGTPDHACLSEFGWIRFSEIVPGDKLINDCHAVTDIAVNGTVADSENTESAGRKVFGTDALLPYVSALPVGATVYFHDKIVPYNQIGNVAAYWNLKQEIVGSCFFNPFDDSRFMLVGISPKEIRKTLCSLDEHIFPICVSSVFDEMIRRMAQSNLVLLEKLVDRSRGLDTALFGDGGATHFLFVVDPIQKFTDVAKILLNLSLGRFSHVENVRTDIFESKVYDIQTESGTYMMANGMVCHNCIHDLEPVISEESLIDPSTLTAQDYAKAIPVIRD